MKVYSLIPLDQNCVEVEIRFNYFNETPFVSKMETRFTSRELEYVNTLTILLQKLNQFSFTKEEYWSLNAYDQGPYIEYNPESFLKFNLAKDDDYSKIEMDLLQGKTNLEDYFIQNSGYWFNRESEGLELSRKVIGTLKENF